MKRNNDDRLFDLAFGDLSETEAAEFEARMSAEPGVASELSDLRTLKADLKSLADIPPHQLSNDRLRDAILGQGLKPTRSLDWSWLWMPALSCALVAGLLVGLHRRQVSDVSFVGGPVAESKTPDFARSIRSFTPMLPARVAMVDPVAKKHEVTTIAPTLVRNHVTAGRGKHGRAWMRRHQFDKLVTMVQQDELNGTTDLSSGTPSDPSGLRTAELKPVDNKPVSRDVVVIGTEKDKESGTQEAREVGNSKNVVFGG